MRKHKLEGCLCVIYELKCTRTLTLASRDYVKSHLYAQLYKLPEFNAKFLGKSSFLLCIRKKTKFKYLKCSLTTQVQVAVNY